MEIEGSNKRKATFLVEGEDTEVDLSTLLVDFIERSDERLERIEEVERRLERIEERLVALTNKIEDDERSAHNLFEKSSEETAKASTNHQEDLSSDEESIVDESDQWSMMFRQLREYRMVHGHCKVPQQFKENKKLGRWVNLQRQYYNNVQTGKGQKICPERITKLDGVGFNWGRKFPPPPSWDDMFEQLHGFLQRMGHCNVPFRPTHPSALAKWTAHQRAEYKRFRKHRDSLLTKDQIGRLEGIGFDWKGPKL